MFLVSIVPPEHPKARSRERPMSHCAIITITTTTTKQDGRKLCFLSFSSKSHKKRSSAHISSRKITRSPLLPHFSLHVCVSGLSAGYLVLPLAFFLHLSVQTVSACDTISIQSLTLSLSHPCTIPTVPPAKITILDEQGAAVLNNVVGPYRENADINMTCISSGGQPAPKVTWWREHALLDDSYLVLPDGTVKNVLYLEKLSRHDLHSVSCVNVV